MPKPDPSIKRIEYANVYDPAPVASRAARLADAAGAMLPPVPAMPMPDQPVSLVDAAGYAMFLDNQDATREANAKIAAQIRANRSETTPLAPQPKWIERETPRTELDERWRDVKM